MRTRYVALLRGINVGGKNKLAMKDLRDVFTTTGCNDVVTYIQSGNVVFEADPIDSNDLAARLETQILERFEIKIPVILRNRREVDHVVEENPFLKAGVDESRLHVMFLKASPSPERIGLLDPNRSPGDSFVLRDRDIFLHLPKNVADSKFTNAYFDSKLATISTGRNWRTIRALLDMMKS